MIKTAWEHQKSQADPHHALRIQTAEIMLSAPPGELQRSVGAVMKDMLGDDHGTMGDPRPFWVRLQHMNLNITLKFFGKPCENSMVRS